MFHCLTNVILCNIYEYTKGEKKEEKEATTKKKSKKDQRKIDALE
tara:strand:+ start:3031 stop:3165 length:135 start_codon:yes stop_codon:yes gene_type:complete